MKEHTGKSNLEMMIKAQKSKRFERLKRSKRLEYSKRLKRSEFFQCFEM